MPVCLHGSRSSLHGHIAEEMALIAVVHAGDVCFVAFRTGQVHEMRFMRVKFLSRVAVELILLDADPDISSFGIGMAFQAG